MNNRPKYITLSALLLLLCGRAMAQVKVEGNVYGGGNVGKVTQSTTVQMRGGTVEGSAYGGGRGTHENEEAGLVKGNATFSMSGGTVERSIYGGGQLGSVGTFTYETVTYPADDPHGHGGVEVQMPTSCAEGTGLAKVLISGGHVGHNGTLMPASGSNPDDDDRGYVFCGSRGEADTITYPKAFALGVVDSTYLEISGTALITASVYGGCEDGLVLGNTHVKMTGGQIGTGLVLKQMVGEQLVGTWDGRYDENDDWGAAKTAILSGNPTAINTAAARFHECDAWPYGVTDSQGNVHYYVYDIYANQYESNGGALEGANGHSFFGNVFGGGSGFYPIAPGIWRRSAGRVNGNTFVEIEGGHVLTNIYGGNEMTDVLGKCTVTMTGGTLGVPRTLDDIAAHPVTCYLFGGSMGDARYAFNTWTNIQEAEVNIGGTAFFFGSVFGGGEDGHVLGDVTMNINNLQEGTNDAFIGTWGYSYVDGNVFGGGRGFDGHALTAGSVGGNVELNIGGGTMLGSIYGGGRLASVGTGFYPTTNPLYGQMQAGNDHGIVRVNITGGTIGNDYESKLHHTEHTRGGNVFGGSMGRLELLDGSTNPMWPNLGKVKNTYVSISGDNTIIKGNVYGGSELGTLSSNADDLGAGIASGNATVTISGGTIWRNVFGGSFGSDNTTMLAPLDVHDQVDPFMVNPMQRAGRIDGNTIVNINGGWVKKSVYGGGELASVGTITELPTKHEEPTNPNDPSTGHPFNISWPYEFVYADGTGTCTVNVTGGRVGLTGKDFMGPWNDEDVPLIKLEGSDDYVAFNASQEGHADALKAAREDNGDVYGAGKGIAGDRYVYGDCANANNTVVTVTYDESNVATPTNYMPSDWVYEFYPTASDWSTYTAANMGCIPGALYGGGENGHVNTDASVTLNRGLVGHNIYGGGKGSDTYQTWIHKPTTPPDQPADSLATITSITAGKVFGNTYVNVNGGYVVRNVFGGGNQASVGKGNYASGPNDFTPDGYGEQWTADDDVEMQALFDDSGHTNVNIFGGTIGTVNGMKDGIPTGNVYGSSRGAPAPNVRQEFKPRIYYYPEFFLGYTNHTHVVIGEEEGNNDEPRLYGSVFGGGENGHVRWNAEVTVNNGVIGNRYDAATIEQVGTDNVADYQWRGRGCVFGGGAGLGKFTDNTGDHYSTSAGSVTQFTTVDINGGTIYQNVYGGGPLSSVGPPAMGQPTVPSREYSLAQVNIHSAIGDEEVVKASEYGGSVYGAARGVVDPTDPLLNFERFSTTMFSEVNIYEGASVPGDVYGGGQLGQVKNDTKVNMIGGTVGTIGFTKTDEDGDYDCITHTSGGRVFGGGAGYPRDPEAGLVKGNSEVNISGGHVFYNVYGGGEMASVGQHTEVLADPNDPNSEVIDFIPVANTGLATVNITGGQVGPAPKVETGYNIPVGVTGTDGYVFGGGMGIGDDPITTTYPYGRYYKFANVNYTSVTVNITSSDTINNRLWGSVFGGSEDGHVLGSDTVRFVSGFLGTTGTTSWDGNIFGGGRNFSKKNYTAGRTRGNNTVEMTGGQIFGNIYGGGRLALTGTGLRGLTLVSGTTDQYTPMITGDYGKTKVMVKGGIVGNNNLIETFSEHSMGNVYGGGMGDMGGINVQGHPAASALLLGMTKNTEVEISGGINDTHVYGIVFGGGETANVGQYTWHQQGTTVSDITITEGLAKVTVSGGTIGGDRSQMRYDLEDPSDPTNYWSKYNDDLGYVYGGGEGESDDPDRVDANNNRVYPLIQYGPNATETISLLDLMATVNNTDVTVSGGWVKASVFGGGESGHVRGNTKVTISGGQIGAGSSKNGNQIVDVLYNNGQFVDPLSGTISSSLNGTYHWDYGRVVNGDTIYTPYDPAEIRNNYDVATGTYNYIPSDGKSWFGNVFGGGSGWFPYVTNEGTTQEPNFVSHWNPNSGKVWGDTEVNITGGHILNNVYGGNESTNVDGMAVVKISGGTVGVPRTNADIKKHPIISNVFGGGCGDPRRIFDNLTNVDSTYVHISGGIVYGSVFGGAEDGHVLDSTYVVVGGGIIGSSGLSGYDGHVFGGGMGDELNYDPVPANPSATPPTDEHPNFAVGRVGGNTHVKMTGGTALGNLYGGGNVALTGVDANGSFTSYINTSNVYDSTYHGRTMVEVSGGTIGNGFNNGLALLLSDNDLGNVYGGGRGKLDDLIEDDWGRAANAVVRISGNPTIYSSVFGGGQMANIGHWKDYTDWYTSKTGATHVTITGSPTIGTAKEFEYYSDEDDLWTWYDVINGLKMISHTCTGNVFGGGQGDVEVVKDNENNYLVRGTEQGHCGNTIIEISGSPTIMSSVFGGSEDGAVWGDTKVKIAGGTIGKEGLHAMELNASNQWVVSDQTYSFGNVFGGSYGKDAVIHLGYNDPSIIAQVNSVAGRVYGNTSVEITGGQVCGNVFGGANMASVGEVENNGTLKKGQTTVKVGGSAIIGPLDGTGLNAYVFGGGKGYHEDPDELRKAYANVNNTKVTVSLTTTGGASITPGDWVPATHGGRIWGSAFGGGSDGHVLGNAEITVSGGLLGTTGTTSWDGNIFGGGRNFMASNLTNGRVGGNITVTMKGGTMLGSIFGGGRLANTGIDVNGAMQEGEDHGYTYVYVGKDAEDDQTADITIGHYHTSNEERIGGNVYGGAKGEAGAPTSNFPQLAKVKETHVIIDEASGKQTFIRGSVFGSGEDGHVMQDTHVTVKAGQIGGASYVTSGEPVDCGDIYHGNVYGGGRGLDTYTDASGTHYSETAGEVYGNANVTIEGGRIVRNVYGGGNLSSVGVYDNESNPVSGTGMATVTLKGGKVGIRGNDDAENGNVFGSSHGKAGAIYHDLAFVHNTVVCLQDDAEVYGSVFGGGEDGHVNQNTKVIVKDDAVVGFNTCGEYKGNVYGGGRGIDLDQSQTPPALSPTAGLVKGQSHVFVESGTVYGEVFGGGHTAVVENERIVNIDGGLVKGSVFGGGRSQAENTVHKSLKTVNIRGGHIEGNVFGCSEEIEEGEEGVTERLWQGFVNITGGRIDQNVYAAGAGGSVIGSLCLMVGKEAILNAPTYAHPSNPGSGNVNQYYGDSEDGTVIQPTASKLRIGGSLFGGSQHFGTSQSSQWNQFDITGASALFVDGTDYNMEADTTGKAYMYIAGGIYGSGELCESGASGREIIIRAYGDRVMNTAGTEVVSTTRPLTTIQRGGIVLLDDSNIRFTGAADISQDAPSQYAVLKVDNNFLVAHGSSLVLEGTNERPVLMDSIRDMRSVWLKDGVGTAYDQIGASNLPNWEMVGINGPGQDTTTYKKLYHVKTNELVELTPEQENVIIFRGLSKLYVRYHTFENGQYYNKYGHLFGFFRMRANSYYPTGMTSFARARVKITNEAGTDEENDSDGGFLSYRKDYNFYTDFGEPYTNTLQHPYTNVYQIGKDDRVEYREWVILENNGKKWYVDGTRNWGRDDLSKTNGWGLYPDKPKKTVCGAVTYDPNTNTGNRGGIITETSVPFDFEKDVIYIVGALSATDEGSLLHSVDVANQEHPLLLYRYPGGHCLSNGNYLDWGTGSDPDDPNTNMGLPEGTENHAGPGPNYGALLRVQNDVELTLLNDQFDGLYGFETNDVTLHQIPTSWPSGTPSDAKVFTPSLVTEPLVVTEAGATLTLKGGTTLMRGYNNTDAATTWYYDADYAPTGDVHHGGALFVAADVPAEGENPAQVTTVNVEGKVTITGNKQNNGGTPIESNVYLPTFDKHLTIIGDSNLDADTRIGVTSPKRNNETNYMQNTFSPVAEASTASIAQNAWQHHNFFDDLDWFFVNAPAGESRTTYYDNSNVGKTANTTLYLGWTWANVVRKAPTDFTYENIDSPEDLAWLISKVNGMNEQTASTLDGQAIIQTADLDLQQYVWLPIGDESHKFSGRYEGRGHTLSNLYISFIGDGDRVYERNYYGLFGNVGDNGTINRTFVVSGKINPVGTATIGGLVGKLEGTSLVSNSEAAVEICYPVQQNTTKYYTAGGLVGQMVGGDIHSSMAMPNINLNAYKTLGGLVGTTQATADTEPKTPTIKNAFANGQIAVGATTDYGAGGLVGRSQQLQMENCYSHNSASPQTGYVSLVSNVTNATVQNCYGENAYELKTTAYGTFTDCYKYTPVINADNLGYMYSDNIIQGSAKDTALFAKLNVNSWLLNKAVTPAVTDSVYAHWARPGLSEINGDLPVLLLSEFGDAAKPYQGDFRSMATCGNMALQYGGPVRDTSVYTSPQLDGALTRATAGNSLFIYGDVVVAPTVAVAASKVSVHEHASILHPGTLVTRANGSKDGETDYTDTYVGITFDNSYGHAYSTPSVNYGLVGWGGYLLPRDYHMFSTPLGNAPLGFDYQGHNMDTYTSGDYDNSEHFNNPWVSQANEFTWLNNGTSGDNRYWMGTGVDGYFPSAVDGTAVVQNDNLFVENSDECPAPGRYRYPYGMDLYAWDEPSYHWINFKRNGPNHWHSDENSQGLHEHLDYFGSAWNVNEETLIVGKGYLASITIPTFLQSHGTLNAGNKTINLTEEGHHATGWNLVGNPYHGYIDFDLLAGNTHNTEVLAKNAQSQPFYVVYDADEYQDGYQGSGFLYQPADGSRGGEYAGRYIHPHQGFYVKLADGASNKTDPYLQFTESMVIPRSKVKESHFRDEWEPNYPLVNLYLSSDKGCRDVTVIEFDRPEWGGATKLKELRVGNGIFYGYHDDDNYAALFVKKGTQKVPVRFEAKEDDIFTLKWNTANGNFHSMYLIDNITGIQYDMLRNDTYVFEGHKSDYWSRFLIVFDVTDVEEHGTLPFAFFDGSQWVVSGEGDLEMIDVLGHVLMHTHLGGEQTRVRLPKVAPAVYFLRLTNGEACRTQKIVVK